MHRGRTKVVTLDPAALGQRSDLVPIRELPGDELSSLFPPAHNVLSSLPPPPW